MKGMKHPNHSEQHIRDTAKFKLIGDQLHLFAKNIAHTQFQMLCHQILQFKDTIGQQNSHKNDCRWWRIYLDERLLQLGRDKLDSIILLSFQYMLKLKYIEQHPKKSPFFNVNNLLIELVAQNTSTYCPSHLDINCIVVRQSTVGAEEDAKPYALQCYEFRQKRQIKILKDFDEQINVKIGQKMQRLYLVFKDKMFYLTPHPQNNELLAELNPNHLAKSQVNVPSNTLVIKMSAPFLNNQTQEQATNQCLEEVELHVENNETFQLILSRINRIKYCKYHIEEPLIFKERYSFDCRNKEQNKNDSQCSPQKTKILQRPEVPKSILHQISGISTNAAEQSRPSDSKKNKVIFNQTKNLKISQRVMPSPKDSNMASEMDYPVSVRGQNDKEVPYFDEFQTLLGEEEAQDQNKLALNDSFQQFEKKEQSEKNMNILMEVNKRKDRESKDKQVLEYLKDSIKKLISEEKQWISANLKLKVEIKRLKANENKTERLELEEIKNKMMELKHEENLLNKTLEEMRNKNTLETLNAQSNQLKDCPSKQEIGLPTALKPIDTTLSNINFINMSVRSNGADDKLQTAGVPSQPTSNRTKNPTVPLVAVTPISFKQNYKPYYQQVQPVQKSYINIYSSVPVNRKYVVPHYIPPHGQPHPQFHSANVSITQAGSNNYNQHNISAEGASYIAGNFVSLSSPRINSKKNALQYFMTPVNKI